MTYHPRPWDSADVIAFILLVIAIWCLCSGCVATMCCPMCEGSGRVERTEDAE